jgi:transcriptional regulator with XRE-family HTH domain
MVTPKANDRQRRFRAALHLAGMTQREWAKAQGVSAPHVTYVLRGERVSPRLEDAITAFIAEHLPAARRKPIAA